MNDDAHLWEEHESEGEPAPVSLWDEVYGEGWCGVVVRVIAKGKGGSDGANTA